MTDELLTCGGCGKQFKSRGLGGHQRWCKKWPGSPRYEGKKDDSLSAGAAPPPEPPIAAPAPSLSGDSSATTETGSFYPPLADWRESGMEPAGLPSPEGEEAPPEPGKEAIFDTTGLWMGVGNFIDESLLKDKKAKVKMSDAKAKLLDGSLHQLGIMVEAPPQPIFIAYWMPFAITVFSVFVLPIVLAYVPDLLKNVKLPWQKKEEEAEEIEET